MRDYNNAEKLYQAIVTSIYGDRRAKDFEFGEHPSVELFGTTYYIEPNKKHLTHPSASTRFTLCSVETCERALSHKIASRDDIQDAFDDFLNDDLNNVAVFSENTGTSKTGSLVRLFDRHPDRQMIATFHTREARDHFVDRCESDVKIVYSNTEIMARYVPSYRLKSIQVAYKKFFDEFNKAEQLAEFEGKDNNKTKYKGRFEQFLDNALEKALITESQKDSMLRDFNHASYLLESNHQLAMTSLKFLFLATYKGEDHNIRHCPVFVDELLHHAQVTNIEPREISLYNHTRWVYNQHPACNPAKLLELHKVCFITADRQIEHELSAQGVDYTKIGQHCPMYTPGLEIARVGSTSRQDNKRDQIINKLQRHASLDNIIANATDSDNNYTVMKGCNDFTEANELYIIVSFPAPDEIAKTMVSCNVDESEATRIVVSDTVNQMIGRNQGYRNASGDNHCLVILPAKLTDIDLDFITDKITQKSTWQESSTDRSSFYFRNVINDLYDFVDDQTAIHEYLTGEQERGVDEVMVNTVANEFELDTKAVGWILKNLGYSTKRRKKAGIQYKAVILDQPMTDTV